MNRDNPRFRRYGDRDEDDTRVVTLATPIDDDTFREFARWVNNPVSAYATHHVPDDLRAEIDAIPDPAERARLQTAIDAYEDALLTPRDFVRIVAQSDDVDHFDPLYNPYADADDMVDTDPFERRLTCEHGGEWHEVMASLSTVWCRECEAMVDVEFRTLDGHPIDPDMYERDPVDDRRFPWVEILVGLLIAAAIVGAYAYVFVL